MRGLPRFELIILWEAALISQPARSSQKASPHFFQGGPLADLNHQKPNGFSPDQQGVDSSWMLHAVALAKKGWGRAAPNPMVGAVLVRNSQWISEGYHNGVGCSHAEKVALKGLEGALRGTTAYVTLEPCSHKGRTGPCAQALVDAGVSRVVIGTLDPNPLVAGKGIDLLKNAGVEVSLGVEEETCLDLIRPFAWRMKTGRPWVHAKWAMSADGKIASISGDSRWISGVESRAWVHRLRGGMDAIVVGSGTVLADDPMLNPRPWGNRTPVRILLDRKGRTPSSCNLAQSVLEGQVILITNPKAPKHWKQGWRSKGVEVVEAEDGLNVLVEIAQSRGWTEILIEGGGGILGSAFAVGLVNEVHLFVAPKILGGLAAPGPVGDPGITKMLYARMLRLMEGQICGPDIRLRYLVEP